MQTMSRADWEKECELMGKVYSYKYLNIGATGAQCNTAGLHLARDPVDAQFPIVDVKFSKSFSRSYESPSVLMPDNIWRNGDDLLLLERAWVLQERLFCPRIIHFSSKRLFWECKSGFQVQGVSLGVNFRAHTIDTHSNRTRDGNQVHMASTLTDSVNLKSVLDMARRKSDIWCKMIVETYTVNAITYRSDILPALTGKCQLHRDEHRHKKDKYLAGMWLNDLPEALTWYYESQHRLPNDQDASAARPEYIAPSWSWAATFEPVLHLISSKVTYGVREKLIDHEIRLKVPSNPYGEVKFASITFEGRLERMRFVGVAEVDFYRGTHVDNKVDANEPKEYGSPYYAWFYYPDRTPEYTHGEVLCLPLLKDSSPHSGPSVWGNTLKQMSPQSYVRTGAWTGHLPRIRLSGPKKQLIRLL